MSRHPVAFAVSFVVALHGFAAAFATVDFERLFSVEDFVVAFVAAVGGYPLPWRRVACHLVG